ncbi:MAG TPA: lysophospholipid acyltransferase family protein [Tepidisphaeraceae bacterium]|nr:lysophospholipid acyltransferase family protein [Tepidisphaeraceae bacterium]
MSDRFYNVVVAIGRPAFWVSARPVILGAHHAARPGPYLLASNHLSPYDVPALYRHTPRHLDFVSIVEVMRKPLVGWLFTHMNAFPLDRSRSDPRTVRIILDRLARGRAVAMFPEGRIRKTEESVITGHPFRPGVGRIAKLAGVPIVPTVVWGMDAYARFASWLPLRRVRYGVIYGEPIEPGDDDEARIEQRLAEAFPKLWERLREAMQAPQVSP